MATFKKRSLVEAGMICTIVRAAGLKRQLHLFALLVLAQAARGLTPPEAVEAAYVGSGIIRVYWNPVPEAQAYIIRRDGQVLGRVGHPTTTYDDAAPVIGITHSYTVSAIRGETESAESLFSVERADADLPRELKCEVLVVGATTAGVAAAVAAGRSGLDVVLIEETRRLGGMTVNGLGASDIRRQEHSSGFFEEFRLGVAAYYGTGNGLRYEPRVAHEIMRRLLYGAPGVRVFRWTRPIAVGTVQSRKDRASRSIQWVDVEQPRTGKRSRIFARLVIDATECGDVAAWAGAPYRVGREPRSKEEPHAGHIYYDRARDRIMEGSTGRGDRRVQAYAYLITVKDYGPGADKTIPKPEGYDPEKYRYAPPWHRSWNATSGKLPNDKYEINQHPYGSDLQGVNYDYPEASYERRREIEKLYRLHALGYLYWIQTGEGLKHIGLSEDDFRADDGWPTLLYIREARRFIGDVIMNQSDIMNARLLVRPDAIGLGDYAMDSHATQPKTDPTTPDMGEGEFYLPQYTPWHQIPFRIMVPKRVDNLFVPTAVSATHVAYGTYRMEPVRMHFGTASGVAAALCLRYDLLPRDVPVNVIQRELLKRNRQLTGLPTRDGIGTPGPMACPVLLYKFPDITAESPYYQPVQWLGARGFYPCPPPAERTPVSGLAAEPFRPHDPLTAGEMARLLGILAWRARAAGETLKVVRIQGPADRPVTRADVAQALAEMFEWRTTGQVAYADLEGTGVQAAAEALRSRGIDTGIWGVVESRDREGRPLFEPNKTVTRGQFAWWLYLAHRFIGPMFYDHPLDRQPHLPAPLPCESYPLRLE